MWCTLQLLQYKCSKKLYLNIKHTHTDILIKNEYNTIVNTNLVLLDLPHCQT